MQLTDENAAAVRVVRQICAALTSLHTAADLAADWLLDSTTEGEGWDGLPCDDLRAMAQEKTDDLCAEANAVARPLGFGVAFNRLTASYDVAEIRESEPERPQPSAPPEIMAVTVVPEGRPKSVWAFDSVEQYRAACGLLQMRAVPHEIHHVLGRRDEIHHADSPVADSHWLDLSEGVNDAAELETCLNGESD